MRNRIRMTLWGGLGNQLFSYYAGAGAAARLGVPLEIDTTWTAHPDTDGRPAIRALRLPGVWHHRDRSHGPAAGVLADRALWAITRRSALASRVLRRRASTAMGGDPLLDTLTPGMTVQGYFQSWEVVDAAMATGSPRRPSLVDPSPAYTALVEQARRDRPVVVHVRRGDYVQAEAFGLLERAYYDRALAELSDRGVAGPIWVFSDDPEVAAHVVPHHERVITGLGREAEDLMLMGEASAHVIANSTFGWWGAYFNESRPLVVAPDPWFRDLPDVEDLIPPTWIRVQGWP